MLWIVLRSRKSISGMSNLEFSPKGLAMDGMNNIPPPASRRSFLKTAGYGAAAAAVTPAWAL